MGIIKTENLTHAYSAGTAFNAAIDNINIDIEKGEFVGVIGHTGSGKSTLVQHFNGLLKPTSGRVLIDGEDIWGKPKEIRRFRFKVGLVFQYPEYQLFEETVYKDIAFGPGNMDISEEEIDERVRQAAGFVGLSDEELEKSPFDLSGGQKRRAAIAGVIAMRPDVLILDEPTAGLDPAGRESILENIVSYHERMNTTVIFVTHSMEDVARLANRIVVMRDGGIAMDGTPREVFTRADELEAIGLSIPTVTQVMLRLRGMGLDVDSSAYTMEQAVEGILALRGGDRRW